MFCGVFVLGVFGFLGLVVIGIIGVFRNLEWKISFIIVIEIVIMDREYVYGAFGRGLSMTEFSFFFFLKVFRKRVSLYFKRSFIGKCFVLNNRI